MRIDAWQNIKRVRPRYLFAIEDIPDEGVNYGMNRARMYILAAVTIIWASVISPARATAAQIASDATNLRHIHDAVVEGATAALGENRASQVMSQLLPDIRGKQVVILTITYPPGHSGAVHRHNAHAYAYVLEGSVVMGLNGGTPVTLTPGQTFYEGPNDTHTISRNASKTSPAKFLVFLIKNKDAPIIVPAK
jgi:quercetin dioxygenase-like cupin family protein